MIKVYEVSRKYIMLFMHKTDTFNWFTDFVAVKFLKYFINISPPNIS